MSKRQVIRERRRRQRIRQRALIIVMVVLGALLVVFALVFPSLKPINVVQITPQPHPMADMNTMGDPNAPVLVEVWEDFQCPACKNYSEETETQIIEYYVATGKVYYIYHHYPFIDDYATTQESDQSANASMCAGDQGRFWDYHDMLFANWDGENQGAFADRRLVAFAENLGLDMTAFNECFNESRYQDAIDKDFEDGVALGVSSTPSIYVDKVRVESRLGEQYVPGFEDIAVAIEAALTEQ